MAANFSTWLQGHRAGIAELSVWAGLYAAFVISMATGDSNGVGYFQQQEGASLWAPLVLGGAVNAWIIYLHAFKAIPLLLAPRRRIAYLYCLAWLTAAYLLAHLAYQLVLSRTLEPALRSVSVVAWTRENLVAAPALFFISLIYRFGRDWVAHARERTSLLHRAQRLEEELMLVKQELRNLSDSIGPSKLLRFESSREKIQLPAGSIRYVKAAGNYVEIVTGERSFTVYAAIKDLLAQLPPAQFMRVHRSYIVNADRVVSIRGRFLQVDDEQLPIGASYKSDVMKRWREA